VTAAAPPGPARSWVEMLPEPWDKDPKVVVVMAPREAKYQVREMPDTKTHYGVMTVGERIFGLQVLNRKGCEHYIDHEREFQKVGCQMAMPAHIGKLSEISPKLLNTADFRALLFMADKMTVPYFNLPDYFGRISLKE
jgi:hypothetical protein